MTAFPGSPRLLKGGLVLLDPDHGGGAADHRAAVQPRHAHAARCRSRASGGDGGDRSEALRLKGPPVETIKLDAEIDADRPARVPGPEPDGGRSSASIPQLAALETIVYPTSAQLQANNALAAGRARSRSRRWRRR